MASHSLSSRTSAYQPALAWFAAAGAFWVFVLVTLGAFTTSIGAGMAFPDWPLSNGSINPEGWLTDLAMFAEHSHRLTGTVMGLITIGLAIWLWRKEDRRWVRRLGYWALVIVIVQGLIGGKRVLLDAVDVPGFAMTLGQMLRIPHGILAQVFVCLLIATALALSRPWIEWRQTGLTRKVGRLGAWCSVLLLLQLTIAAVMRHNHAGLAIPSFPLSSADGDLLPPAWNFQIGVHFAHRVMAVVLSVVLVWFAVRLARTGARGMKGWAITLMILLGAQITLGAFTIWSLRGPYITTAHVIGGALLLALTFGLTCWSYRPQAPERAVSQPTAPAAAGTGRSRLARA